MIMVNEIIKGLALETILADKVEYIIAGTEDGRWNMYSIAPKLPYKKDLLKDAKKVLKIFIKTAKKLDRGMRRYKIFPALANRSIQLYNFDNRKNLKHVRLELKNAGGIEIVIQPYPLHWKELRRPLRDPEDLIHILPHWALKEIIKNPRDILQRISDDILNIMEIYYPRFNFESD